MAATRAPLLTANGIGVTIGRQRLLADVSLSLQPGEITCLLGPNGAGKSTLLRVLSGAPPSAQGEVRLAGRRLSAWSPVELARRRAVLSQNTSLGFGFTAAEVVALGRSPHLRHSSAALDRAIIDEAMAATDVGHLAARRYPSRSGGEQQRVQLARVLAQLMDGSGRFDGRLLMLDEPTAGLDLAHQHQLAAMARRVAAGGGAVVAILHDLNLAAWLADQIGLLQAGRLQALGPPAAVLTSAQIGRVFGIRTAILPHPEHPAPLIVPLAVGQSGAS